VQFGRNRRARATEISGRLERGSPLDAAAAPGKFPLAGAAAGQ
jgi:hypothetical protein